MNEESKTMKPPLQTIRVRPSARFTPEEMRRMVTQYRSHKMHKPAEVFERALLFHKCVWVHFKRPEGWVYLHKLYRTGAKAPKGLEARVMNHYCLDYRGEVQQVTQILFHVTKEKP